MIETPDKDLSNSIPNVFVICAGDFSTLVAVVNNAKNNRDRKNLGSTNTLFPTRTMNESKNPAVMHIKNTTVSKLDCSKAFPVKIWEIDKL